ncbi:MAG: hypothetical protein ABSH50_03085 [Bryobacteraceae bacterium]|jgi:hypothetical protein
MKKKLIWLAPLAVLALLLFISLGGEIVQHLWNWLLPPLFGWRQITFWQGLGMLALCRILFGGFGIHADNRSNFGRRKGHRMADRWQAMTSEERERFRQGMRAGCGSDPSTNESKGQ